MKVQRILELLAELNQEKIQAECDTLLVYAIYKYFSNKAPQTELKDSDISFLIERFALRWTHVQGKAHDYTLSDFAIEQKWVSLARELAPEAYLKILMPTITNDTDPLDNSALTKTVTMTNFYLVNQGKNLCRKRSLCDYLLHHRCELNTSRKSSAAVIFTLDELSRLRRCKVNSLFSIESPINKTSTSPILTEHFSSFWDFMCKKVFTQFASYGDLPVDLLPCLLNLVELYFSLKSEGKEFNLFRREASKFFERLYNCDQSKINSLYGQKVVYKEQEHYLLDAFIEIFDATEFSLEHEMEAIARLLFTIHPVLKVKSNELKRYYIEEQRKAISTPEHQVEAFLNCCRLLVSLFVTKFELGLFIYKGEDIFAWDQQNEIPQEFHNIYLSLIKAFNSEKLNYVEVYNEIIECDIAPKVANIDPWARKIRASSSHEWLNKVHDFSLSDVGGYWFPPQLIIYWLLKFKITYPELKSSIANFLDELVTTYTQSHGSFSKEVRINILFSHFLSGISENQRNHLIQLMSLCNEKSGKEIKSEFISNCVIHINSRLVELGYRQPLERTFVFFQPSASSEIEPILSVGAEHILDVIENYAIKLKLDHLETEVQEKIRDFLFDLKNPILSCADRNDSIRDTETRVDPLGQPS